MIANYAVLVYRIENEEQVLVMHFTAYEDAPTEVDLEELSKELRHDEEFGLTEYNDLRYLSIKLPQPAEMNEISSQIAINGVDVVNYEEYVYSLMEKLDELEWVAWDGR